MHETKREPKLPVQQLVILFVFTSVFPYLPEMIESFNVPKDQVGKWVGLTSASFSLSQCLTGILLGRASDRYGRKPVILLGVACTMASSLGFGFARSLAWAIAARSVAGASAGTIGIIRTTVAEMVPERALQPRAFSVMPLVWSIGTILGPVMGGALAKPANRFPRVFGDSWLFTTFPFALPNLVACVMYVIGITTGILFLKETLQTKKHDRDYGRVLGRALTRCCRGRTKQAHDDSAQEPLLGRDGKAESEPPPSFRDVFSPQSNVNLLVYTLIALHSIAFDSLIPVFLHLGVADVSAVEEETRLPFKFVTGFGLDSGRIGVIFMTFGLVSMALQFLVFPPVARRFGVLRCLRVCTAIFPLAYLVIPFTALFQDPVARQVAVTCLIIAKNGAGVFAFPCTTILLTNSASSLRLLGTLNGVATSISAIGRAAGPSLGGALFTRGIDIGYIILPWWSLAAAAVLAHIPTWWIIETEGFGADKEEEGSDDDGAETASPAPLARGSSEVIAEEDDDEASETTPLVHGRSRSIQKVRRRSTGQRIGGPLSRQMSGPIGMGKPLGRSWSSNVGQAMSMHGGSRPYH